MSKISSLRLNYDESDKANIMTISIKRTTYIRFEPIWRDQDTSHDHSMRPPTLNTQILASCFSRWYVVHHRIAGIRFSLECKNNILYNNTIQCVSKNHNWLKLIKIYGD